MAIDDPFRKAQAVGKESTVSTDVFRLVPHLEWRGRVYPIASRSMSFRHEQIEHKIQYRGNDFIESLGPHSFMFRYTFPMREDIAKGPYKSLFNEGLTILVRDCRNREPGILIDPFYGEFRCIPTSFEETSDINKRDGTDVQVEFLHSPTFDEGEPLLKDNITGVEGLVSSAGALEADVKAADWNQEPSPEGLTDALSAINGVGQKGLRQIDRTASRLDDLAFKLKKIEDTADAAENPQNWRLRDSARGARDAVVRAKDRATEDPTRKVRRVVTRFAKTLSALALETGMTIQDLLALNPSLRSGGPLVPGGSSVAVYHRAKR